MTTKLLKEEADLVTPTGIPEFPEPQRFRWSAPRLALAAGDHPVDAVEVDPREGVEKWLSRDEPDCCRHGPQGIDPP